ncbi:hypothetical protein EDD86DRAFT_269326 [Gorgonomyces haynaldii]|nr:hypothetical protein EDD86DRAFT_269326 [Gorgonomyces haynaldii]
MRQRIIAKDDCQEFVSAKSVCFVGQTRLALEHDLTALLPLVLKQGDSYTLGTRQEMTTIEYTGQELNVHSDDTVVFQTRDVEFVYLSEMEQLDNTRIYIPHSFYTIAKAKLGLETLPKEFVIVEEQDTEEIQSFLDRDLSGLVFSTEPVHLKIQDLAPCVEAMINQLQGSMIPTLSDDLILAALKYTQELGQFLLNLSPSDTIEFVLFELVLKEYQSKLKEILYLQSSDDHLLEDDLFEETMQMIASTVHDEQEDLDEQLLALLPDFTPDTSFADKAGLLVHWLQGWLSGACHEYYYFEKDLLYPTADVKEPQEIVRSIQERMHKTRSQKAPKALEQFLNDLQEAQESLALYVEWLSGWLDGSSIEDSESETTTLRNDSPVDRKLSIPVKQQPPIQIPQQQLHHSLATILPRVMHALEQVTEEHADDQLIQMCHELQQAAQDPALVEHSRLESHLLYLEQWLNQFTVRSKLERVDSTKTVTAAVDHAISVPETKSVQLETKQLRERITRVLTAIAKRMDKLSDEPASERLITIAQELQQMTVDLNLQGIEDHLSFLEGWLTGADDLSQTFKSGLRSIASRIEMTNLQLEHAVLPRINVSTGEQTSDYEHTSASTDPVLMAHASTGTEGKGFMVFDPSIVIADIRETMNVLDNALDTVEDDHIVSQLIEYAQDLDTYEHRLQKQTLDAKDYYKLSQMLGAIKYIIHSHNDKPESKRIQIMQAQIEQLTQEHAQLKMQHKKEEKPLQITSSAFSINPSMDDETQEALTFALDLLNESEPQERVQLKNVDLETLSSQEFSNFHATLKSLMEEAKQREDLEQQLKDAKERLQKRDEYMQSSILDTAKKVNELEQHIALLEQDKMELLLDYEQSQQQAREMQHILGSLGYGFELASIRDAISKKRPIKLTETNSINTQTDEAQPMDAQALLSLTQHLSSLSNEKQELEAELQVLQLQVEHLESVGKERSLIIADLIRNLQQKDDTQQKHLSVHSWADTLPDDDYKRKSLGNRASVESVKQSPLRNVQLDSPMPYSPIDPQGFAHSVLEMLEFEFP